MLIRIREQNVEGLHDVPIWFADRRNR